MEYGELCTSVDLDKLDLLGRVYLVEHCVYAWNQKQERRAYELYVTDRLKAINDSVASYLGGSVTHSRYLEILQGMKGEKAEERTAEQVISSISRKIEALRNDEPI